MDYYFEFIMILWMLIVTVYCVLVSKMNQLRSFDSHGNFEKQVERGFKSPSIFLRFGTFDLLQGSVCLALAAWVWRDGVAGVAQQGDDEIMEVAGRRERRRSQERRTQETIAGWPRIFWWASVGHGSVLWLC